MRLGIVSDTHGNVANARAAAHLLSELDVDVLLHCGDVGSVDIARIFAPWPTHYVIGNCDVGADLELAAAAQAEGGTWHGLAGSLELAGRRIGFTHGHERRAFQRLTTGGGFDLVCYGHTHEAEDHRIGATLVLNPGALHRANPHSFAVVDLSAAELSAERFEL